MRSATLKMQLGRVYIRQNVQYLINMNRLLLLILFAFISSTTYAEKLVKNACNVSEKEIYSIITTVIHEIGLHKEYRLHAKPILHCSIHGNDSAFLQTLLKIPQKKDTVGYYSDGEPIVMIQSSSYPEKNLLLQSDINELLCSRAHARKLIWNNSRFRFNAKNKNDSYGFSMPYFNNAHDVVVLMYQSFCPGLCGTGETLVLKKEAGHWRIHVVDNWVS